jgi:hypothetical protein
VKRAIEFHKYLSTTLEILITRSVYLLCVVVNAVFPEAPKKVKIEKGLQSRDRNKLGRNTGFSPVDLDRDDPPPF